METKRILAFSDLNGSPRATDVHRSAASQADLVIRAGDFCIMRQGLDDALCQLLPRPCPAVVVPGNAKSVETLQAAIERVLRL